MAKKSWWRLPYVGLALTAAAVWGGGSTYWYVCKTQQLCDKNGQVLSSPAGESRTEVPSSNITVDVARPAPAIAKTFFLPDSTEMVEPSNLSDIIAYAKKYSDAKVQVAGYHANVDSGVDVGDLSQLRAAVMKQQLLDAGVPESQIVVFAKGADMLATGDEAQLATGRRVEVSIQ